MFHLWVSKLLSKTATCVCPGHLPLSSDAFTTTADWAPPSAWGYSATHAPNGRRLSGPIVAAEATIDTTVANTAKTTIDNTAEAAATKITVAAEVTSATTTIDTTKATSVVTIDTTEAATISAKTTQRLRRRRWCRWWWW